MPGLSSLQKVCGQHVRTERSVKKTDIDVVSFYVPNCIRVFIYLQESKTTFRMLLNESTRRLKLLSKKLGSCIDRARPYYDALEIAKRAQVECQRAAVQFQRASGK